MIQNCWVHTKLLDNISALVIGAVVEGGEARLWSSVNKLIPVQAQMSIERIISMDGENKYYQVVSNALVVELEWQEEMDKDECEEEHELVLDTPSHAETLKAL